MFDRFCVILLNTIRTKTVGVQRIKISQFFFHFCERCFTGMNIKHAKELNLTGLALTKRKVILWKLQDLQSSMLNYKKVFANKNERPG